MQISSNNTIIAPMATAIWLVDNTSLTFKQIGDFCNFTETEVQLIADGVIGKGISAADPIKNKNLTNEEIRAREKDGKPLNNAFKALDGFNIKIQKKKKYIPMLQRRSRPNAVLWLVNYFPSLEDSQIMKLLRTTKNMVQLIRNKEYSDYNNLIAKDPVILGFCSQNDIINAVNKKAKKDENNNKRKKSKKIKVENSQKKAKSKPVKKQTNNLKKNKVVKKINKVTKNKKINNKKNNSQKNNKKINKKKSKK
jgi:hypothetical protein